MATVVRQGIVCEHCGKFLDFSYGTESATGVLCLYCRGYVEIRDDLLVTLRMETTNMANTQHTPTPWTIYDDGGEEDSSDIIMAWIDDEDSGEKYDIAAMLLDRPIGERKANAEFIVRTCNSHDDLVDTLQSVRWFLMGKARRDPAERKIISQVVDAIAKAKGGA